MAPGPFLLDEYIPGELIRLTANQDYHLGAPHVAQVDHILSGGDALLMYENDEIHVTGVGLTSLDAILDPANPLSGDVQRAPPSFSTYYMGLNVEQPPFDDLNVRLALNHAIDRATISEVLLRGLLVPAEGVLPPSFPGYDPNIGGYPFDPEKAKRLLAESKIRCQHGRFPGHNTVVARVFRRFDRPNHRGHPGDVESNPRYRSGGPANRMGHLPAGPAPRAGSR